MDSPDDGRDRSGTAVRVAGVGLGILGATFGVAGWFTLAPSAATTESVVVTTGSSTTMNYTQGTTVRVGKGRAHTHTGGAG